MHDEDVPAEERDDFGGVPDGKIPAQEVQIASHELNRIDLHQLSRSAFKWKSKATLRLIACVLVQGMSTEPRSLPFPSGRTTYCDRG